METVNWEEVNAQVPKSEILNNIQDWAWCHPGSVPLPPHENKKNSIPPQKKFYPGILKMVSPRAALQCKFRSQQ